MMESTIMGITAGFADWTIIDDKTFLSTFWLETFKSLSEELNESWIRVFVRVIGKMKDGLQRQRVLLYKQLILVETIPPKQKARFRMTMQSCISYRQVGKWEQGISLKGEKACCLVSVLVHTDSKTGGESLMCIYRNAGSGTVEVWSCSWNSAR